MTPEKLFHELLGLGLNWKVEECEFKREDGVVYLRIRETEHLWEIERCPESGKRVKCYDHVEEDGLATSQRFRAQVRDSVPVAARAM